MDDNGNNEPEDEPAEPARDAAQGEGAKLRKVSEEELRQILAAHKTWLETDEKEGARADLSRTDLQGADLRDADLREADLRDANLQGADLRDADLRETSLAGANLQGTNLTKAKNLTWEQLDGTCGDDKTKLPSELAAYQMKACPTPEQPPSN